MSIKTVFSTLPKFGITIPYINSDAARKSSESSALPPIGQTLRLYFRFLSHYRRQLSAAIVAMPVVVLVQNGLLPVMYAHIIDRLGETRGHIAHFGWWMVAFLGLHMTVFVGQRVASYAASYLEHATIRDLEQHVFATVVAQNDQFHAERYAGALVAQAKRFTGAFSGILNAAYSSIYSLLIRIGVAFGFLLVLAPTLAFLLLAWTIAYVTIIICLTRLKMHASAEASAADSTMTAHLGDTLSNIGVINLFGSEEREGRNYKALSHTKFERRRYDWRLSEVVLGSQALLMVILEATVLYLSVRFVEQGIFTVGRLALVQFFLGPIMAGLWQAGAVFRQVESALSDAAEMTVTLGRGYSTREQALSTPASTCRGDITFRDVGFGYSAGNPLLQHFNLHVGAGETVGLVGPSGSGKSTVTKLLPRIMNIQHGQITIDGQDIAGLKQAELRRLVAFVPQEPQLFHRTIRENIRYGKPDATDDEIMTAAKQAQAHTFIARLPEGYDTAVGERGSKLSGGERQRIAIARAILKDAPIVVLDEATSALDTESERLVQQAFLQLVQGRTAIVIAHRLSTVRNLDRILVLKEGVIVEEGTHNKLLERGGFYARLWQQQTGSPLETPYTFRENKNAPSGLALQTT